MLLGFGRLHPTVCLCVAASSCAPPPCPSLSTSSSCLTSANSARRGVARNGSGSNSKYHDHDDNNSHAKVSTTFMRKWIAAFVQMASFTAVGMWSRHGCPWSTLHLFGLACPILPSCRNADLEFLTQPLKSCAQRHKCLRIV